MMKFFDKISKIFFAFLCFIVVAGMIFLSVRNYTTPVVNYTTLLDTDKMKTTYYFNGTVSPKLKSMVEVKAAQDMLISNINIKNGQIAQSKENLFTLDINNSSLGKQEAYEEYDDKLYDANNQINDLLKELSKKLNRQIKNVDDVNPNDGIAIYAPSNGKIKSIAIKEGEKVNNELIANIIDDTKLKIAFRMTVDEYSSLSVNQDVLLSFTGYEGYYKGKIDSINPNAVAHEDKISFVYNGTIVADNPGLIYPGVNVSISSEKNNQPVRTLTYAGKVESYKEQISITSAMYSNQNRSVKALKVYVLESDLVKEGQLIARLGGDDVVDELQADIKNIKDKIKIANDIKKNINGLYGDVISCSADSRITIDSGGSCFVPEAIYIDYVTDKATAKKDDVLLRYYTYSIDNLAINANLDSSSFKKVEKLDKNIYYGSSQDDLSTKAILANKKEFLKYYELEFNYQETDIGKLNVGDNVLFKFEIDEVATNVIPKTAIIPIGKLAVGSRCYVYIINTEDSILGNIDVLEQKEATIEAIGDKSVSIKFNDNFFVRGDVFVVNYINSTLEDGMRVKTQ